MASNKLYAFFTKSLNNTSFDKYTQDVWVNEIRKNAEDPYAEVFIIKQKDWQAPNLKSIELSEVRAAVKSPLVFMSKMLPILKKYGVPVSIAPNCMMESWSIPFPDFQMVAYVLPYTIEMQSFAPIS